MKRFFSLKKILVFNAVSVLLFLIVSIVLVFWPVQGKQKIKNYDHSSLNKVKENPIKGEERWFTLSDHTNLFYRYYQSTSRNTLILIHGSGSDSRYLDDFASYIAKMGIANVITPDLRGHGRSANEKGDIQYIGQFDDDLNEIIKKLRTENPAAKIILGGHSSGGGLTLRYSGNNEVNKADGYLMFTPYLGHKAPTLKPKGGNWVTVAVKRWVGLSMLTSIGIKNFNHLPVLFFNRPDEWNDNLQTAAYSYRLAVSLETTDYKKDIKNLDKPVLVLVGENDESFYANEFPEVFKGAGAFAEVDVLKGAKHLDILDNVVGRDKIARWFKKNF